jgi:hypothetical protein
MSRPAVASLAALFLSLPIPRMAVGQVVVRGTVIEQSSGAPVSGARVIAIAANAGTVTDGFGRFRLPVPRLPDTLVVSHIGSKPERRVIDSQSPHELRLELTTAPVNLAELLVTSSPRHDGPIGAGEWRIPLDAIRAVPAAVEPDVFRALSLVPSVSFSTPLSARPIIRGYDASESIVRIDGYEVANPYHFGRIFSAFPAAAAQGVSVRAGLPATTVGGTLAGTIDIDGRVPEGTGMAGGVDLSLVSASGWLGSSDSGRQLVAAGRTVHLAAANLVAHNAIPYSFQDGYGSARFAGPPGHNAQLTVFGSHDHLFDPGIASGMDWDNILVGARSTLFDRGTSTVSAAASATSFSEDVTDFPARSSRIDVRNDVRRVGGTLDLTEQFPRGRLQLGLELAWRGIDNHVKPRSGEDFAPTDVTARYLEAGFAGSVRREIGSASLELGLRVDRASFATRWQPRLRFGRALGRTAVIGISAGRSSRLYQIVSDPLSEPDLAFYDFRLPANRSGTPTPSIDHVAMDLDFSHPLGRTRISLFASRGHSLMELAPPSAARADPFRIGSSRTAGIEVHSTFTAQGAHAPTVAVTYVLSTSQRRWTTDWIPWTLDRRHLVRVVAEAALTSRLRWSTQVEAASAMPLTPVNGVALRGLADPAHDGLERDDRSGQPIYVFGDENSTRGSGTVRIDASLSWRLTGPWHSRMYAGLSIINLGFGGVSPLVPAAPALAGTNGGPASGRVAYERLFSMPAVPTITLRAEF